MLEEQLAASGTLEKGGVFCRSVESAMAEIHARLREGDILLKAAHACAGRGHRKILQSEPLASHQSWVSKTIKNHGGLMVEPWLDRVLDFSSLYEIKEGGAVKWIGMTRMENDAHGRFLGTIVHAKWGSDLDPEIREFLFRECKVAPFYRQEIPAALQKLFTEIAADYTGPVGVDAMVYRKPDGSLGLRHIIELNVRMTMGRVALELFTKLHQKTDSNRSGRFRILRKNKLSREQLSTDYSHVINSNTISLNDPEEAHAFVAIWEFLR